MKIAIKSFLWVSSAYDEPGVAAYQIDAVETAETMAEIEILGGLTRLRPGLNVEQALALGIDLSVIAEAINVEALVARERAAQA